MGLSNPPGRYFEAHPYHKDTKAYKENLCGLRVLVVVDYYYQTRNLARVPVADAGRNCARH